MIFNDINYIQKTYFKGFFKKNISYSLNVKNYRFKNGIYGIIGKNGSGKTTLAKSLAKLIISSQDISFPKKCIYLSNKKHILNKGLSIKDNLLNYFTVEQYQNLVLKNQIKNKYSKKDFIFFLFTHGSNFYNFILDEDLANLIIPNKKFEYFFKNIFKNFFLIISHDTSIIQKFCENCFLINNADVIAFGKTYNIYQIYHNIKKKSIESKLNINFLNLREFLNDDNSDQLNLDIKKINLVEKYCVLTKIYFGNNLLSEKNYTTKKRLKILLDKKNLLKGNYKLNFQISGLNHNKEILILEELNYEVLIKNNNKKKHFNQLGIIKNIIKKI